MQIFYSALPAAVQAAFYARVRQVLSHGGQAIVIVPAQASFLTERGILDKLGLDGFLDLEVLSFEKLTERVAALSGGRAVQTLDASGFAMLAKLALAGCAGELFVLDSRDPSLHMRAAELIASLKSEGIAPEEIDRLADGAAGGMQKKLRDIALVYRRMQALAGEDFSDSRDLERMAQAEFSSTPLVTRREVLVYGFDVLPELRMRSICALAATAREVSVFSEAAEDGVLDRQWGNLRRLAAMAERGGIPVRMHEVPSPAGGGEAATLFQNLYAYPWHTQADAPVDIRLLSLPDRAEEVRFAAAEILRYTCREGGHMRDIGVIVGDTAAYARAVEQVFSEAEIPFFLQGKRSLSKSGLWAWMKPLLALLYRENWRVGEAMAYAKSALSAHAAEADGLVRYCRERGVRGYQIKNGLGADAPPEIEALRQEIFAPLNALRERVGQENLSDILLSHMRQMGVEECLAGQAEAAEAAGLLRENRFLRQVYPAAEELLQNAALLGRLSVRDYADALEAGFAAREIAVLPPSTDEVVVGDAIHAIWARKKRLFVLGMNEGMLPGVPDEGGLITGAEAEELRMRQPQFPSKMSFADQKAYLRKNLTLGEKLYFSFNRQDGQPSFLVDRLQKIFPAMPVETLERVRVPHRRAMLGSLAGELRAAADEGALPGAATAAYFAGDAARLGRMLAEVYQKPDIAPMSERTARALYGAPRATVSRLEGYYRCPYRHFVDYGLRPQETRDFGEDAMQAGTYVHALLEEFTAEAQRQGADFESMSEAQIDARLANIAARLRASHNYGIFLQKRYAFMEKRLREEAGYAMRAVRAQFAGTRARIAGEELSFGGDILRIPTRFGMLTVRGKIDRVDTARGAEDREYLRVVDYKTGARRFSLSDVYYGVGLQLVVYLMATENRLAALGHPAEPAGGFYFSIRLPYLEEDEEEGKRLMGFRMNGFLLASYDAARALDAGDKKLLSMNAEIDPAEEQVRTGDNCFTREELQDIFAFARHSIVQAAEQIYGGKIEVCPLEQDGRMPCDNCPYGAVCMRDAGGTPSKWAAKMDKEEALLRMRREMEEEWDG